MEDQSSPFKMPLVDEDDDDADGFVGRRESEENSADDEIWRKREEAQARVQQMLEMKVRKDVPSPLREENQRLRDQLQQMNNQLEVETTPGSAPWPLSLLIAACQRCWARLFQRQHRHKYAKVKSRSSSTPYVAEMPVIRVDGEDVNGDDEGDTVEL